MNGFDLNCFDVKLVGLTAVIRSHIVSYKRQIYAILKHCHIYLGFI